MVFFPQPAFENTYKVIVAQREGAGQQSGIEDKVD